MKNSSIRIDNEDITIKKPKIPHPPPLRKVRKPKKVNLSGFKENDGESINEFKIIDKWENDKSTLNFSALFENNIN